ncbi:tRNA (adenosine(37)-N6)-threonylcarbamoyltransferase complex dimerization subunit type 1 TsaB [Heliophilum fasciatum]|uniref:tRNA threonylcarbamoyladenosine biosynthesis protein TsaB n=1 Tax=Heliophilum fasciatum TaxID=35700 RepID=A0A4R2RZF2_9FIRM|nr:tRNA (adenosine(37)-N6)-threonylcarbamoyltransferase complex dimerization subunit type 1 TsaB [Heliophilum fasciatum]MCW2276705.1 tRNA threonylcarbamoyladenosine biosynthesis protein TsaB [Heliophilum fasciatum]TCP68914.1 tRNA threonylcarbamoyladenosine biosynthesis protein TsaB [Heliophilum fasciatum]
MLVLGLDCATGVTAMAILDDQQVVAEMFLHIERPHSERLIPLLHQLLQSAGMTLEQMTALAVSVGPGSFTGLRIGLATIKGLAHPLGLPVVGVSTLEALAGHGAPFAGLVCPVLDARKNEVYTCLYRSDGQGGPMERLVEEQAINPRDWLAILHSFEPEPVMFVGDAVTVYQEIWRELGPRAWLAPPEWRYPRGVLVARLGRAQYLQAAGDGRTLSPRYLRPSEAEVTWAKKHGQGLPKDGSA